MTLNDLLVDCCTRLNYAPDLALVDAKVKARLTAFLNQTQNEILGQPSYRRCLMQIGLEVETVPGQWAYGLPMAAERVVSITDPARQLRLGAISVDAFRNYTPDPSRMQGSPTAYAFDGWGSFQLHPTETEEVWVLAQPLDVGTIVQAKAVINFAKLGLPVEFSVTIPAGLSVLLVPAGAKYVFDVHLDKPVKGIIVDLVADSPGTHILARIPTGQLRPRYAQIYLSPTPSDVTTLRVVAERAVSPMVDPWDETVLPPRFQYLLATGARMKEYELRGDSMRYQVAKREYDVAMGFMNAWVSDQPDAGDQMHPDDHRGFGYSVLGPWFPPSGYRRY